jgi:alkylation response protein AidB-like acyl-CoA dehydrogenase
VEFSFETEQEDFRQSVRSMLSRRADAVTLRHAWEADQAYEPRIIPELARLGVTGVLVEPGYGGSGGSLVDMALVLEECGYWAVPEPVVETMIMAPVLLERFGSQSQKAQWLPRLVGGALIVAASSTANRALVPDGGAAHLVLVRNQGEIHAVPRERVAARPRSGVDPTRRLSECDLDTDRSTLLSSSAEAIDLWENLGAYGVAALLVGIGDNLMTRTRDYVLQREQFGQPIGAFQAIKHRLADVCVALEAARSLTWYAAYQLSVGAPDAGLAVSMAKASANSATRKANFAALQLHGGVGFTWEHDLHLWLQRATVLESHFGTTAYHRRRVGFATLAGRASENLSSGGSFETH